MNNENGFNREKEKAEVDVVKWWQEYDITTKLFKVSILNEIKNEQLLAVFGKRDMVRGSCFL